MKNGQWYKFYIENTGVHKIDKDFLEDLGINTANLDPRKLKIYGHGGSMLPMLNSEEFPIDPIENSIKFVGQNESTFNNDDYILFYAQGPTGFNGSQFVPDSAGVRAGKKVKASSLDRISSIWTRLTAWI